MKTLALLAPLALALAACDCNCDSKKEPAVPTTPVSAASAKPAAPAVAPDVETAEPPARTAPVVTQAWRGSGATLELSVWEMHCMGCASKVEKAFAKVPGVQSAEADYESSVVKVTLTDAAQRDAVIAALPAALKALNAEADKDFKVLGL
jgi:Cu+-exporting ATPase